MTISSVSRESAHGAENRASRINGTHFQKQQSPSQTAKLCRESHVCAETRKHCLGRGGEKRTARHLARRLLYFFSTLKGECVERHTFHTRQEARSAIFEYIECFYNRVRRHSTLSYLSPVAYEQQTR